MFLIDEKARTMKEAALLENIKRDLPELQALLDEVNSDFDLADYVYRFYHHSFKVFYANSRTTEMVEAFKKLAPEGVELNKMFMEIVTDATGRKYNAETNPNWLRETRPVVEAAFHARQFLEMIVKYGKELDAPVQILPSGWAHVLYLFNLR